MNSYQIEIIGFWLHELNHQMIETRSPMCMYFSVLIPKDYEFYHVHVS